MMNRPRSKTRCTWKVETTFAVWDREELKDLPFLFVGGDFRR